MIYFRKLKMHASKAFAMKNLSGLLKFLKDPHAEKIQKLKARYLELDDLSIVAVEIGNTAVYRSLQQEMREVFFDYLTAIAVDSVYSLAPHVLIIWLISLKWSSITVPLVKWQVNILGAYLHSYILIQFGHLLLKQIKTKFMPKFPKIDFIRSIYH